MTTMTMVQAINAGLHHEMERDDRVVVFGQDVAKNGGVFRATEGLLDRFGGERVVDTPLAEAAIVGSAIGLAVAGMVPVAEIHQIVGQLARLRYRTDGRFTMPVVVRAPFGGGVRTPELHSDSIESQLANCPGLKIAMPSSAADAKGLLAAAVRDPDPVLFLEPLRGYRSIKDDVPDGDHVVPFGQARTVRSGDHLVIIAWSYMVEVARRASVELERDGIAARVLDLRTLVPLDVDAIREAVEACGRVVVVQEAPETAGFASEIVATIVDEAFYSLEAPIARVSAWDVPYPVGLLEDHYVPNVERVVAAARRVLA
jgi:pyruvate dehydrogenase E1 component subunit beta